MSCKLNDKQPYIEEPENEFRCITFQMQSVSFFTVYCSLCPVHMQITDSVLFVGEDI